MEPLSPLATWIGLLAVLGTGTVVVLSIINALETRRRLREDVQRTLEVADPPSHVRMIDDH